MCLVSLLSYCIEQYTFYKFINYKNKNLTIKQKAYILSIRTSILLSLYSLYYTYIFTKCKFDIETYNSKLLTLDKTLHKNIVLFFTSYLIMDMLIGKYSYPQYMTNISGNIHHSVYICINYLIFKLNLQDIYILFYLEELPTVLLSIGQYNQVYRNDNLFGFVFFKTRILYHVFLLYKTYGISKVSSIISFLALLLHTHWFKTWFQKYFLKSNKSISK
jgi:betaine lipid synthase